jgi:hypothetical protein
MNMVKHTSGFLLLTGAWAGLFCLPGVRAFGDDLSPLLVARDVDLPACQTFHERQAHPASADEVLGILGLGGTQTWWSAGRLLGEQTSGEFRYRVAFQREIPLGTILLDASAQEVRLLRADAPYPGDPWNDSHWSVVCIPPHQPEARVIPMAAGVKTRALLLVDHRGRWKPASGMHLLRLLPTRLYNVTPLANAYGDREYTPPNSSYIPDPAANIPAGKGRWVNVGKDSNGLIPAPPVSDVHPSWFLLSWHEEQFLSGIALRWNAEKFAIQTYEGPADINPRAASADEWRTIEKFTERVVPLSQFENFRWIRFPQPVHTRGLRITILKSAEGPVASISSFHALTDLGAGEIPQPVVSTEEPPPTRIACQLPEEGNLTMAINDAAGRRTRNLFARETRGKGNMEAAWDLKDEDGNFVLPGVYRWTALLCPEFLLRYEMTLYPNVSQHAPANSPWLNGQSGSGGWLADHSAPLAVCTAGDRVYLGAPCCESGVSLIECDLDGRKLWGYGNFSAWVGPRFLASDGKEVFVAAPPLGSATDTILAVDIASKNVRTLCALDATATRRRGVQGLASVGDKLYLSVRAQDTWLENAAAAEDADPLACLPNYRPRRKQRVPHEMVPDPRNDFLCLFRLKGMPPGGETPQTLTFLETPGGPHPQQHIVLTFQKLAPLGSVVFPVPQEKGLHVTLSVLKQDALYPPNPDRSADWIPFRARGKQLWDAIPAPEGTLTRALRITFSHGDENEDPVGNLQDLGTPSDDLSRLSKSKLDPSDLDLGGAKGNWQGRLEGMKLLRRRFANVAGEAAVRFNSGKLLADGTWDAERTRPLTESDPGIYVLQWKTEQKLRGLAIKEIDGARTKIDVFTGTPGDTVALDGTQGWQEIAEYQQERRAIVNGPQPGMMNAVARYVDGYVDFGREIKTRAVRLRVIEQWSDNGPKARMGVRMDLGGGTLDAKRCRVFGVAALQYLGGEVPVDSLATERIEVYNPHSGKLLDEIPLPQPGQLAVGGDGSLLAISGTQVVRVDPAGKNHQPLITDLQSPVDLAAGPDGQWYVFDAGPDRNNVRVYDTAGKYRRSIGTPGGLRVGPWDPTRMGTVTSLSVDRRGQLWVVENQFWPKRVTLWSTDGTFQKEFLGNTAYGGGGVLDPQDKTRLFYGPLEFAIDWQTGLARLKNLTSLDAATVGEVPIRVQGRTYLVTRPQFIDHSYGVVYLYEKDHLRPVAAMGNALAYDPLKRPEVLHGIGSDLADRNFLWCDRNGDGAIQPDEVVLSPGLNNKQGLTNFNRDLSVQFGDIRYQVREFLPNGVPVYEEKKMPVFQGQHVYRLDDGNFYRFGADRAPDAKVDANGNPIWSYPHEGWGVQALHHAKPYRPNQVVAQFGIVGHETAHAGGLGEFWVIHSNPGTWNVWTSDGLLVGPIFRDLRHPKACPWSMTAHDRGMILADVTAGEEHFAGYFCRTADNRYYAVAGHNHISILEVLGLDRCQRFGGELTITADDVRKAQQWDMRRQHEEIYQRSPVVDVYRLRKPPEMDGKLEDWGAADAEIREGATLRLAYDDTHLYLVYSAHRLGPLVNKGHEWDRLFKTGAAVDLLIGTNAAAPGDRQTPQAGDVRLLMTYVDNRPVAVLYRPVVPGTPPGKAWRIVSPVGETVIDEVKRLDHVRMLRTTNGDKYTLEAAIPLADLGLKPEPGARLKFDWGILVSGTEGSEVFRRVYWANHSSQIAADAPSEARLQPNLWGYARFQDYRPTAEEALGEIRLPGETKSVPKGHKDLLDSLDELRPAARP